MTEPTRRKRRKPAAPAAAPASHAPGDMPDDAMHGVAPAPDTADEQRVVDELSHEQSIEETEAREAAEQGDDRRMPPDAQGVNEPESDT